MGRSNRKTWWITRPTRDLHDIESALKYFHKISGGKRWRGDRYLHQTFEAKNPAKTPNAGKVSQGGGGRTWAAWLRMWGLWYDSECVTLTPAGRMIVEAKNHETVHKQIVHLIMRFQITNAYLDELGMERGFRVFPFRFLLDLMLHKDVGHLTLDEIGLFVLDVKTNQRLNGVARKIKDWRKEGAEDLKTKMIRRHMKSYGRPRSDSPSKNRSISELEGLERYWKSVIDIAHTFAYNLSFITEIEYSYKKLHIQTGADDAVRTLLGKYDDTRFIPLDSTESIFLKKFGACYDKRKSSDKDTIPMSKHAKQHNRINEAVSELKKSGRFNESSLVRDIKKITNYSEGVIEKVLSEDSGIVTDDEFANHYMECAIDGRKNHEFEELTRLMFVKMGFQTEKRKTPASGGEKPGEIDGLVLNRHTMLSGILECKSGKQYGFTKGDAEKMKHVYIKHFKTKKIDGKRYHLDFFTYVVGKKATSQANFRGIISDTGIRGSIIYARDFMRLYCMHLQKRISQIKIWGLFKTGELITWNRILAACDKPQ